MTPNPLTSELESYRYVENQYAIVEAQIRSAISNLQIELELIAKSREYIAGIRRRLEADSLPEKEDLV